MTSPQTTHDSAESNIDVIVDEILAIAQASGIGWSGVTEWDLPAEGDVTGTPWLAVAWPECVEYGVGQEPVGEFMARADFEVQIWWDIQVYCLAPYDNGNPTNKRTTVKAGKALMKAFVDAVNLGGTCDVATIGKPAFFKIGKAAAGQPPGTAPTMGAVLWFAAVIPVRVQETVPVHYYADDV